MTSRLPGRLVDGHGVGPDHSMTFVWWTSLGRNPWRVVFLRPAAAKKASGEKEYRE